MNEVRHLPGKIRSHKQDKDGTLRIEGWANVESIDGKPIIDTYRTVFPIDKFDLSRFEGRSRPMFFNHDYDAPIGLWDSAERKTEGGWRGIWMGGRVFGDTDRQQEIQTYVKQGTAPDLSIGFEHLDATEERGPDGEVYTAIAARMLETSVVTVGSNPASSYDLRRALIYGDATMCARCADQATIVSLPNVDAALRSLEAHAKRLVSEGSTHVVEVAARRIESVLATMDGLRCGHDDDPTPDPFTGMTEEEVAAAVVLAAGQLNTQQPAGASD